MYGCLFLQVGFFVIFKKIAYSEIFTYTFNIYHGIRVLQNNRLIWVGSDLQRSSSPTSFPWVGTPSTRPGFPKIHLTLNISGDEASTASLVKQFQCFTNHIIQYLFLISSLNLLSFSQKKTLSLANITNHAKKPVPIFFTSLLSVLKGYNQVSPERYLQAEQSQLTDFLHRRGVPAL